MESSEPAKQTKSAEELAGMIREDLSKVNGCLKHGVNVTVYEMRGKRCSCLVRKQVRCPTRPSCSSFSKS